MFPTKAKKAGRLRQSRLLQVIQLKSVRGVAYLYFSMWTETATLSHCRPRHTWEQGKQQGSRLHRAEVPNKQLIKGKPRGLTVRK